MSPNDYASTWLTILTLSALGLGTVAMLVRWLFRVQRERPHLARDFVADVKRGEGFTFYKTPPQCDTQEAPPLIAAREWLRLVNDRPDEVPHVGIEGATGTTKTTLAEAIVTTRAG